jgi:Tfp pilus assembly protein PilO
VSRIPADWRRRLPLAAAGLLFAVGNLVFYLSYRTNTHVRREALEARRDALKAAVEAREAEAARLSGQRDRLSGVSDAMEEFYGRRIGTQQQTLAAVVADLHAALKDAGIEASQIGYSVAPVTKLPLTQLKISFPIRCDYSKFKKLLRTFETGKRWLAVQSVAIRRDGEQPGLVSVQMELVTYFSERDEAPATPGKPAGPASPAPARGAVPARRTG